MRDRVGVGDLEPAFLQIVAIIEELSADEERTFRIDHDPDVGRLHHDVAIRRAIHEIHLVLQTRAAAANHGDAESTGRASLFFQERIQFPRSVLRDLDETLVADLVIDRGGGR